MEAHLDSLAGGETPDSGSCRGLKWDNTCGEIPDCSSCRGPNWDSEEDLSSDKGPRFEARRLGLGLSVTLAAVPDKEVGQAAAPMLVSWFWSLGRVGRGAERWEGEEEGDEKCGNVDFSVPCLRAA
eukprot:1143724-Pelagomonas_calceolata.AAC.3